MKTWLEVPFADKDLVKRLGAQWDGEVKRWWIPNTASVALFRSWMPERVTYDEWIANKCDEATAFWDSHGNPGMGEALCVFWKTDSSKVIADREGMEIELARIYVHREMRDVFEAAGDGKVLELTGAPVAEKELAWL